MSYAKRDDVPSPDGWTVIEFEDGSLVRVCCDKKTVASGISYHAQAEAVNAQGEVLPDAFGRPIATGIKRTWTVDSVTEQGDSTITLWVLKLVMGEPVELPAMFDSIRNSPTTNIRAAIAAAAVSGSADAGAVL